MFTAMSAVTFFLTVLFSDGSTIKQEFNTYEACEAQRVVMVQKTTKQILAQGCLRTRADGKTTAQ